MKATLLSYGKNGMWMCLSGIKKIKKLKFDPYLTPKSQKLVTKYAISSKNTET